jgi:hypothetical protein
MELLLMKTELYWNSRKIKNALLGVVWIFMLGFLFGQPHSWSNGIVLGFAVGLSIFILPTITMDVANPKVSVQAGKK